MLEPSERAEVLRRLTAGEKPSDLARNYGVTRQAIDNLKKRHLDMPPALVAAQQERTAAVRHGLDDKDAMVTAMLQMADAVMNNFRTKAPDGTPIPDAPMVINGQHSAVLRDVSDTLMKAAKLRGWDVTKTQNENTGEITVTLRL